MNLTTLFDHQRALEAHILETHPELASVDLLPKKIMALQVELGELANEVPEIFKFWSNKKNNTERALEEYVDGLHFFLSIGLNTFEVHGNVQPAKARDGLLQQFLSLNKHVGKLQFAFEVDLAGNFETNNFGQTYTHSLSLFLGLGEMLGFSWEQIEQAYLAKNAVNHARQEAGY